jgi:hypothetical protein
MSRLKSTTYRRESNRSEGGGTGQWVAPIYHWTAHRIVSHVKLCVLALPLERAAMIRARDTRRNIRLAPEELTAVRPPSPSSPSSDSRQLPHSRRYTRQKGGA